MTESSKVTQGPGGNGKLRRIIFATSAGTIFEAYDFILFGSLAPLISRQFFAGVNETAAFIFTLLIFASGFVVRPIGALIFGRMGDKTGRKKTFIITITLMGLATFSIGLLPTYATAGIFAPVLLILLRLIQGLAFGGEYGGAVIYMAEHSPANKRGLYVGWIQSAAGFALFMSFLVITLTRSIVGDDNFDSWGWRIPFLISIFLLMISLWIRLTLEESPIFQKMVAEGKASRAPLREAFTEWKNLKLVLMVLFSLMSVQGVLWYTAHFYSQFFLIQILRVDSGTVIFMMMVVTGISVLLYVFFSWLTDIVGRKPVIMTGMILAIITAFPIFHALTAVVSPELARAQKESPVTVISDQDECSLQFDPVGQAEFVSSCDIAKRTLAGLGISYTNENAEKGKIARIKIGDRIVESFDGSGLSPDILTKRKAEFEQRLRNRLTEAGYPKKADMDEINLVLVGSLIFLCILFAVMVYAPMPTMAIELFPARIRYSALSLPYHIGSGWFGGFLPAIAFAMVAENGNIYFGLWYPVIVTAVGTVVLLCLPETKNRDISHS